MNARKPQLLLILGLGLLMVAGTLATLETLADYPPAVQAGPDGGSAGTVTDTLMALYYSTDGANWTDNSGWGTSDPYCTPWYGVLCDAGDITQLVLNLNNLAGTIRSDLGSLSSLQVLDLAGNDLTGPIPPDLGDLSSLQLLNLSDNNLTGTIPSELGNLSSLQFLLLTGNNLICWETEAARDWALNLEDYAGPDVICIHYCYLPAVLRNHRSWDTYYEENDDWLAAYGPLVFDQPYQAYPDDTEDYYYFELSSEQTVIASVTDYAPSSTYGTLMLYGPADGDQRGELIDWYSHSGESTMTVGPHDLALGKYYVRVNTVTGHYSTTQLYTLTVTSY